MKALTINKACSDDVLLHGAATAPVSHAFFALHDATEEEKAP
jgi:hypothetical protein